LPRLYQMFTKSRTLPLLFCGLVICILVFLGLAIRLPDVLGRIETALLDLRLKIRAESLAPSKDILFVGMDRQSLNYGLNHPETGISGYILPRKELARIIEYLKAQGVKAIVLDLEFRVPQDPQGDALLSQAIQRAGNVYLGTSLELPLSEFKVRQTSRDRNAVNQDLYNAFYAFDLLPYLRQEAQKSVWPNNNCATRFTQLGFAPYFSIENALNIGQEKFSSVWGSLCNHLTQEKAAHVDLTAGPPPQIPVDAPLLDKLYQQECLVQLYEDDHARSPAFLNLLNQNQLALQAGSKLPPEALEQISYCVIGRVQESFLSKAKGLGITTVNYDQDVMLRQIPLIYRSFNGQFYSYLGLRPALDLLGSRQAVTYEPGILKLGSKEIKFINQHEVLINWRNPARLVSQLAAQNGYPLTSDEFNAIKPDKGNRLLGNGHLYRMVSVMDILKSMNRINEPTPSLYRWYGEPQSGPLSFKNKIVIYGNALTDLHQTPIGSHIYGSEILATVLDMMLNDSAFVCKAPGWLVFLLSVLFCGTLIYIPVTSKKLYIGLLTGMILLILFWILNFAVFIHQAYWVPLVIPSLFFGLCLIIGVIYRYYIHDREKRHVTRIFSKYVSPQVLDKILENPEKGLENLSGIEKDLTVLFADLQGFTERFAQGDSKQIMAQLNEFFTVMIHVILKHQGTYDKYIGDAVMAFFGAPVEYENHAENACRAALEMQNELKRLNEKWRTQGIQELKLGIGLSTGKMVVGNFGSNELQNFTVMGNAVNLGSRLESLTRKVNAPIVISEETMTQAAEHIIAKDLGQHAIKGYREPVHVYALDDLRL
jgi:class 3 adenylate cyclase/CHASE2 domain-containing sensor protein